MSVELSQTSFFKQAELKLQHRLRVVRGPFLPSTRKLRLQILRVELALLSHGDAIDG